MSNEFKLTIRLTADGKDLVGAVRAAKSEIKGLSTASTRAAAGTRSLASSMDSGKMSAGRYADTIQRAKGALFAYIGLATAKHLIDEADQWNRLQIRIKTATRATGDYNRVARELLDITLQNGSEMESSVALFQSLARASGELGATNSDILALTRTVQQLGAISGASTANMNAGLTQFSQAMSAGVVRAEEFNSLLENIPEVANRIAVGMGMTVGELRNAVLEGEVLSKDVFDALLGQADKITSQFEQLPLTLDRATNQLSTSFDHFLGQLDQATGATKTLAEVFGSMSESMALATGSASIRLLEKEISSLIEENKKLYSQDKWWIDEEVLIKRNLALISEYRAQIENLRKEKDNANAGVQQATGMAEYRRMLEEQWSAEDEAAVRQEQNAQRQRLAKEQLLLTERRAIEAAREYNDMMAEGKALTMALLKPTELYEQLLDRLFDLYGAGAINLETFNRAQEKYMRDLAESSKVSADSIVSQMSRIDQAGERVSRSFEQAWVDAIKKGEADFSGFVDTIIDEILRLMYETYIAKPLASVFSQIFEGLLGTSFGGGSGFDFGSSSVGAAAGSGLTAGRPESGVNQITGLFPINRVAGRGDMGTYSSSSQVTVVNNIDFSNVSAADEAAIAAMLEENRKQTEAAVFNKINRGGSAARTVGRRG